MKSIGEMLKPRASVFSDSTRDDVLNLSDFAEGRIDKHRFFDENFRTQGMQMLIDAVFKRFRGESDAGIIKLTQAMGGGKTHNMLALALLASDESLRVRVLGDGYAGSGEIKVVTFSGRENADFGIWGSIAEQLNRKEQFADFYSPLRAPGESDWIRLLENNNTLILLDELPPYLENARSITVGNSDLSRVTITALANLFSALGRAQLSNVCLVFSDLKAAYESGSELLQSSFRELEQETNRTAIEITPVALNSDEVYSILKTRLFVDFGSTADFCVEQNTIAREYKNAVLNTKKLGFTSYSPDEIFVGIQSSYPFHPSIKELYARFKENQNFQQTRGLIKLMRQIVRELYESGKANQIYLINVFDVNLNNPGLMSLFRQINPSLENAISHDVAQNGRAVAEGIDRERNDGQDYAQSLARMLLVASLSTAIHGELGLSERDVLGFISAPGADIKEIKTALEELKERCWYIKTDSKVKIYFHNTKNMVAEMIGLADSFTNDNARKALREMLQNNFEPKQGACYKRLFVLPAVDEIELSEKEISLVISAPYSDGTGSGLHPDLEKFYDNSSWKNRVMFLTGARRTQEKLYASSKKLLAIKSIRRRLDSNGTMGNNMQYEEAAEHEHRAEQALLSAIRETFVMLYYPTKNGIEYSDFRLEIIDHNKFEGERQIIATLKEVAKYEEFAKTNEELEILRKKCEQRLFTTKEMTYRQIQERAATETSWPWLHPDQLDSLKSDCLNKGKWRERGGYLIKGPFEKDPTSVTVSQTGYNESKEEFTLRIHGLGGQVFYDSKAVPTPSSSQVENGVLVTSEPYLLFLCIDLTGERKTGNEAEFIGEVPIKHELRSTPEGRVMQLQSNSHFTMLYTMDGSDPREHGSEYRGEFAVPAGCRFVRVTALYQDREMNTQNIELQSSAGPEAVKIDEHKPVTLKWARMRKFADTESSYRELEELRAIKDLKLEGGGAYICEKDNSQYYVDYRTYISYLPGDLQDIVELIREKSFRDRECIVSIEYNKMHFKTGAYLKSWVQRSRIDWDQLCREASIIQ